MQRREGDHRYEAVRRELTLDVPYERFTRAFESLLGTMNVGALADLAGTTPAEARRRLAAFVGERDFALFQKIDHGSLLSAIEGQRTAATTYVFGNALFGVEMTKHEPRVGLYVPLRLFVRDTVAGGVLVTYDLPSATLSQFGSPAVDAVASSLDEKVEKLVAEAASR